jgi:hypothetical protein
VRWTGWNNRGTDRFRWLPQDRFGSVLIALDPALSGETGWRGTAEPDGVAMLFEAETAAWIPTEVGRDDPDPEHAFLGWTFEVRSCASAGSLAPDEIGGLARGTAELDPGTGLVRIPDAAGGARGIFRLRSRAPLQLGGREAVLEALARAGAPLPPAARGPAVPCRWKPIAALHGNERWLSVRILTPGIAFAVSAPARDDARPHAFGDPEANPVAA